MQNNFSFSKTSSFLALLGVGMVNQHLLAAEESTVSALDETARALDEIVVTARRQAENLQEVPIAVTAFSGNSLQQIAAADLGDVQNLVPNLTLHQGDASNAVVYIRGVGQIDSLAFADPGVGIYLDDIYLGRAQGAFLDIVDVERIEVLRGPQGTLYGRNTIGGAVKYVSRQPGNQLEGKLSITAGNYDRRDFSASVGGAVIEDTLLMKASVASLQRDGYADNTSTGDEDGDKDTLAGRVSMIWHASDTLDVHFAVDSSRDDSDTSRTPARATPVFGIPASTDPFKIQADFNDRNELDTEGVSLILDWTVSDNLQFKSITAARQMDYKTHLDLDATEFPLFGVFVDQDQEQFSQEFQFNYDTGDRWSLVAGLYYFKETDVTESGIFGPAISFISNSENDQETTSYAVYGEAVYQLTDQLRLTAGLRYTKEEKDFERVQEFYGAGQTFPPQLGTGFVATNVDESEDWSMATPKLGLDYRLSKEAMIYASISRGFKSGGFDGRSNDAFGATPYDQETLWAYEAGLKSQFLAQRLQLNAAVFFNDYDDLQLSSFTAASDGTFQALFTNAGKAETYGLELELSALVTDQLSLDFNLGYLNAEYKEYVGPNGADISDERELVNSPEWSGRVALRYDLSFTGGARLSIGTDLSYRDTVYPTVSSSEILAQDSYTLWSANLQYISADEHWEVLLSGKNLTDREYITHGFDLSDSLGYQLAYYGAPRTASINLTYRF